MTHGRLIGLLVLVGGVAFGALGGEYSTLDWWKLEGEAASQQDQLARLRIEIDSLRAYADSLETNPITQERVAREKFGMLREGEILYRVEELPARDK